MMAKNKIWEYAEPGARGGTQLEVECLKGYVRDYKMFGILGFLSYDVGACQTVTLK